ncbi:hypothetical protein LG277_03355 [Vreelandella aquamarina]|uniref:hypothetical protein n=1 Tax=Vreelandella aquamarina TaxID=77097 RepID=UPI00384C545F
MNFCSLNNIKDIVQGGVVSSSRADHLSSADFQEFAEFLLKNSPAKDRVDFLDNVFRFFEKNSQVVLGRILNHKKASFEISGVSANFISTFHAGRYVFVGLLVGGCKLYLVQHVNALVGVIDIDSMAYYSFTNIILDSRKIVSMWAEVYFEDIDRSLDYESSDNSLGGFLMNTDGRTSHFFYEFLSVLGVSEVSKLVEKAGAVYFRPRTRFLSISQLLGSSISEFELSARDLQDYIFREKSLVLQPGFKKFRGYFNFIERVDELLVQNFPPKKRVESFFPLVWFSVLSDAKSWKEQNDVIASIITNACKRYRNPCFILDGMTSSLGDNCSPSRREDVDSILEKVGFDFNYVDLHYKNAGDKVSYAVGCDIFLTSMGSDSLYPSRIAGKPGVVHCSPDVSVFAKHRYSGKTMKTDPSLSRFLPGQETLRPDKRSYSISIEYVEELFWKCFDDYVK